MLEDLNLIRSAVWSVVKKHPGLEYDDLFSDACIAYLESMPKYDPAKGSKSTYIWHVVTRYLHTRLSSEPDNETLEEAMEETLSSEEPSPEQYVLNAERWDEFLDSLSPSAKSIVLLACSDIHIALQADTPKLCRGQIVRRLRQIGWSWSKIWGSLEEVKQAVNSGI